MYKKTGFAFIVIYVLLIAVMQGYLAYSLISTESLGRFETFRLLFYCILIGGSGGILYCLRAAYLNYCDFDTWEVKWIPWYIIRPLVSMLCGGVSYIFLKAGLLVLQATKPEDTSDIGFFALAFIAGMNVDNFISKVEDLANAAWGIKKSRVSGNYDETVSKGPNQSPVTTTKTK